MRITFIFIILVFVCSSLSLSEIYKWRDENGKLHFSDTPPTLDTKTVNIHSQGSTGGESQDRSTSYGGSLSKDDYDVSSRVSSKQGIVTISGLIKNGPKCDKLSVDATAITPSGGVAFISDVVKIQTDKGLANYKGSKKGYGGNLQDKWEVERVSVRCNDLKDYNAYKLTSKVSQDGATVTISGTVTSGPKCDKLKVVANAISSDGDSAYITDIVTLRTNSSSARYSGSDYKSSRKSKIKRDPRKRLGPNDRRQIKKAPLEIEYARANCMD